MTIKIIIFLIIVCLLLIFFYWQEYLNFFYKIFNPVLKIFYLIIQKIFYFFRNIIFINKLHQENISFYQENQKLRGINAAFKEAEQENKLLRKQLGIKSKQNFKLVLASVIGTGQVFLINQDISNKPVITAGNILIGKTGEHGQIKLITDPQSKIQALIQETRTKGIVQGKHGLSLIMNLGSPEERVRKGQTVITSGLEAEFPPGLIIGQIIDVQKNDNQTSQKARIQPFFTPKNLEKVFVIIDY